MNLIITTEEQLSELLSRLIDKKVDRFIPEKNEPIKDDDNLLTFKEVRFLLRISRPTLFKYMQQGLVPYKKIGRRLLFSRNEVLNAIELRRIKK